MLLVAFVYSPFNHTSIDLFDNPLVDIKPVGYDKPISVLEASHHRAVIECRVSNLDEDSMCGVTFQFSLDDTLQSQVDFSNIDAITINVNASTNPNDLSHKLRLMVKSILNKEAYPDLENKDYKFHAVRFSPIGSSLTVPLKRFKVETWWEEMFDISYQNAERDFTNVAAIEVFFNQIPIKQLGHYQFIIDGLSLEKYYLAKESLFHILSYFWPLSIVLFLVHFSVTRSRQLKKLNQLAKYEPGTRVLNIHGVMQKINELKGQTGALYVIQIVNLPAIDKLFGSATTEALLRKNSVKVAEVLSDYPCSHGRIAVNEFVILCHEGPLSEDIAKALRKIMYEGVVLDDLGHFRLEVKIGFEQVHEFVGELESDLKNARRAAETIRHSLDTIQVFDQQIDEEARRAAYIESQIVKALDEQQFYLQFMPLFDAAKKQIVGAEALLRCKLETLKSMSPEIYIPVAEKSGLIRNIDLLVIDSAISLIQSLPETLSDFVLSINISSRELLDNSFISAFKNRVISSNIKPQQLCLEITETFFVDIDQISLDALTQVRALGVKISLDDFGTGYTSFKRLANIPVDEIKIDRSFVSRWQEPQCSVVIETMYSIATVYGYDVVAEGVETKEQLAFLQQQGLHYIQGYLISKPTTIEDVTRLRDEIAAGSLPYE